MTAIARVDYIELSSPKTDTLKTFYGDAFGWKFQDYGEQYAGFTDGTKDGEAGGISAFTPGNTPMVILHADDLEAARAGVLAAGGELVGEDHVFPGGRRFHFRDPAGNELAVWTKS